MTSEQYKVAVSATRQSLERMQQFDVSKLPRSGELGEMFNFEEALEPAERLCRLYRQLPVEAMQALPTSVWERIKKQADHDYAIFESILMFTAGKNPLQERNSLIEKLTNAYDLTFERLYPIISYVFRESTDFANLERRAREIVEAMTEAAEKANGELKEIRKSQKK